MKHEIDRREFIKYHMKGALWLAAASSGLIVSGNVIAEDYPDIAVAKGTPTGATKAAVELLGGMKKFVKAGDRVVIKPNMSFPTPPERASNTHPEVVSQVVTMCKEAGASRIMVLDNPLSAEEACLEVSGIRDVCKPIDASMVRMITDPSQYAEKKISDATRLLRTDVMKEALAADVIIAVPVAKSHSGAGVSLSMKGMMGLIYDRGVMHRLDLHTTIVDLVSLLKANLVIVDATRVLSTGGPGGPGKVLKTDTVIASADMVAADAYTVAQFEWYGKKYKPNQVRHIREAHERGLGRMDIENLKVRTVTV